MGILCLSWEKKGAHGRRERPDEEEKSAGTFPICGREMHINSNYRRGLCLRTIIIGRDMECGRKKCMSEANSLKFADCDQATQLYQYASAYFKKATSETKYSLHYLGETARRNSEVIQRYRENRGKYESKEDSRYPSAYLNFSEVLNGRPAEAGSRGKLSGVKNVPRSTSSHDEGIEDLLILESKLSELGLMPPSALLLLDEKTPPTSSSARLDFLSSSLGESFMFLSSQPSSTPASMYSSRGGLPARPTDYFPSTSVTTGSVLSPSTDAPLPYGPRVVPRQSTDRDRACSPHQGDRLVRGKTPPPVPAAAKGGNSPGPYGPLRGGVSARGAYPARQSQPGKTESTGIAYWGATAGGLLAWAAPGVARGKSSGEKGAGDETWDGEDDVNDINWNDSSALLSSSTVLGPAAWCTKDGGQQEDAEGILKLLDTIDRLRTENNRLESAIDALRVEKKKHDLLLQQVVAFKTEYKSKIGTYKKRMKKLLTAVESSASKNESSGQSDKGQDGREAQVIGDPSPVDLRKMRQLERTINGLVDKVKELKDDNSRKDELLRRYIGKAGDADRYSRGNTASSTGALPLSPQHEGRSSSRPEGIAQADTKVSQPDGSLRIDVAASVSTRSNPRNKLPSGAGSGESRPSPRAANALLTRNRRPTAASPATTTLQTSLKREISGSGYLLAPGASSTATPSGGASNVTSASSKHRQPGYNSKNN